MGWSPYVEEKEPVVRTVTRVVEREVVQQESLIVKDGKLVFDREGYPEVRVTRGMLDKHVRVGCHRLTWEAWLKLKLKVEGKKW
jgi:hypothetical protein